MKLTANSIYYSDEYYEIQAFAEKYGCETELASLLEKHKVAQGYVCPNCLGKGTISEKYNAYPSGLPDSGWAEDWKYRDVTCPVCHGRKYVEKKLVPKMVQAGWE